MEKKKLQLNKERIAQLNQKNMADVKGGTTGTYMSRCETCDMKQSVCVCFHSYNTNCGIPDCMIPCETTSAIGPPTLTC